MVAAIPMNKPIRKVPMEISVTRKEAKIPTTIVVKHVWDQL